MKQTAVEWLINKLDGENHLSINEINRVVNQAKAMEKEQIIKAYESLEHRHGENYYNDTYGNLQV